MSADKKHRSYSKSSESPVEFNSETEGSYFQRRLFLRGFSIHARQKGKLTKCQQLNAEMHGQGSLWHHTPVNITWGRTIS